MKKWLSLVLWVPFLLVLIAFLLSNSKNLTCQVYYREDLDIKINSEVIKAEEAKTSAQRAKGLGGRNCINTNQGMLFEFEQTGYYPFWMKDMRFAIDMVWLDKNHKVVTVKPNIEPASYPQTFVNDSPAQYVLELQAGRADKISIKPGTQISF